MLGGLREALYILESLLDPLVEPVFFVLLMVVVLSLWLVYWKLARVARLLGEILDEVERRGAYAVQKQDVYHVRTDLQELRDRVAGIESAIAPERGDSASQGAADFLDEAPERGDV